MYYFIERTVQPFVTTALQGYNQIDIEVAIIKFAKIASLI